MEITKGENANLAGMEPRCPECGSPMEDAMKRFSANSTSAVRVFCEGKDLSHHQFQIYKLSDFAQFFRSPAPQHLEVMESSLPTCDEIFAKQWRASCQLESMVNYPADGEGIDLSEIPAVWNAWKEKGWPGVVRWVQEKRGGLKLRKSREETILNIENLRTECATLRKERDDYLETCQRIQGDFERAKSAYEAESARAALAPTPEVAPKE